MKQTFTKKQGPKRGRQRIQVQGRQGQTGRTRNTARTTGKGRTQNYTQQSNRRQQKD